MRLTRLSIVLAGAAVAAPAAAQAATIAPLAPCYRSVDEATRETVTVQAAGFTPGALVDIFIDGVRVQSGVEALPDGTISGAVRAPYQAAGQRGFTLTATERDSPENTASAASRVVALSLRLKPRKAPPRTRVRFVGRGFVDGPEVFGHYLRGGKLRKTVSFGAPEGVCGRIDVLHRQIPVRRPRIGRWTLQVDHQREYSPEPAGVKVEVPITVRPVLRRR